MNAESQGQPGNSKPRVSRWSASSPTAWDALTAPDDRRFGDGSCTLFHMPHYRCHKEVCALRIRAIEFQEDGRAHIEPADEAYPAFTTQGDFRPRFHGGKVPTAFPIDLGYYVRYGDGYESWSPSNAFEEGYTLIEPEAATA
jgi:hypothetical protein